MQREFQVALRKMQPGDYEQWLERAIFAFAQSKVAVGTWACHEARELSADTYNNLLSNGPSTPGHFIYSIVSESDSVILGSVWLAQEVSEQNIFIYDFLIEEQFRNQGIGFRVLQLIESEAKKLGASSIGLHVFADNHIALRLYEKFGFLILARTSSDIDMLKLLDEI